jgi:hypothetical protein
MFYLKAFLRESLLALILLKIKYTSCFLLIILWRTFESFKSMSDVQGLLIHFCKSKKKRRKCNFLLQNQFYKKKNKNKIEN